MSESDHSPSIDSRQPLRLKKRDITKRCGDIDGVYEMFGNKIESQVDFVVAASAIMKKTPTLDEMNSDVKIL